MNNLKADPTHQIRQSTLPHLPQADYMALVRGLSYQTRGIFERLRDLFDGQSQLEMSLSAIAQHVACSRSLLVDTIRELESLGLLLVFRKRANARRNEVNRYQLPNALRLDPVHQAASVVGSVCQVASVAADQVRQAASVTADQVQVDNSVTNHQVRQAASVAADQVCQATSVVDPVRQATSVTADQVQADNSVTNHQVRQTDGLLPSAAATGKDLDSDSEKEVESSEDSTSSDLQHQENELKKKLLREAGLKPCNDAILMSYPLEVLQRAIEMAKQRAEISLDGYVIATLRRGFFYDKDKKDKAAQEGAQAQQAQAEESMTQDMVAELKKHDPSGQKRAIFEGLGLTFKQYADYLAYTLDDIHRAVAATERQDVHHPGFYMLAILRKQGAPSKASYKKDHQTMMREIEATLAEIGDKVYTRPADDLGSDVLAQQIWQIVVEAAQRYFDLSDEHITFIRQGFIRFEFDPYSNQISLILIREKFEALGQGMMQDYSFWLWKLMGIHQSFAPIGAMSDVWRLVNPLNAEQRERFGMSLKALRQHLVDKLSQPMTLAPQPQPQPVLDKPVLDNETSKLQGLQAWEDFLSHISASPFNAKESLVTALRNGFISLDFSNRTFYVQRSVITHEETVAILQFAARECGYGLKAV